MDEPPEHVKSGVYAFKEDMANETDSAVVFS